jgi:hypothetical protein
MIRFTMALITTGAELKFVFVGRASGASGLPRLVVCNKCDEAGSESAERMAWRATLATPVLVCLAQRARSSRPAGGGGGSQASSMDDGRR